MPLTWNSNESQGIKSKSAVAKMEQELTLIGQEETSGTDENALYLGCGDHMRGCVELCIYNEAIVLFTYTLIIFFFSGVLAGILRMVLRGPLGVTNQLVLLHGPSTIPSHPHHSPPPPQGARDLLHTSSFKIEGSYSSGDFWRQRLLGVIFASRAQRDFVVFLEERGRRGDTFLSFPWLSEGTEEDPSAQWEHTLADGRCRASWLGPTRHRATPLW